MFFKARATQSTKLKSADCSLLNIINCIVAWDFKTVNFKTSNKFNSSLELDFVFMFSNDKPSFVFNLIFKQIEKI